MEQVIIQVSWHVNVKELILDTPRESSNKLI